MKKIIVCQLCLLLVLASCRDDSDHYQTFAKGFNIKVMVDKLETGVVTRGIPAEQGEDVVNNLCLVFYNYHKDAEGSFVGYHTVPTAVQMNTNIPIPASINNGNGGTVTLDNNKDYSVLAFANLQPLNGYKWVDSVDDLINQLKGQTENVGLHSTLIEVTGVGTDETSNTQAIPSNNLFMSVRALKKGGEDILTVNLLRGVARYDVENTADTHTLVSASIWGAAKKTTLWNDIPIEYQQMERFYGAPVTGNVLKGKLYSFENVVLEPTLTDKRTTCVIVGLKKGAESKIRYYRVNLNLKDVAQDLRRNSTYKISISAVTGDGSDTEQEAWGEKKNGLIFTINNWSLDENGMIISDGKNILGIPTKLIRFDPQGDSREFSIHTVGEGVVEIAKSDLPKEADGVTPAFTALIEGNSLKVTATAMPTQESRRGLIEISFAGLRGTIDMIQETNVTKYISLDRYSVPNFNAVGRNPISTGMLKVTASGDWKAEIINTGTDSNNPGFSFQATGNPVTTLFSYDNPYQDQLQVYTTGDNPGLERSGFIMVSLLEDPENYSVAVPLTQNKKPELTIVPDLLEIIFNADKTAKDTNGKTEFAFVVNYSGFTAQMDNTGDGARFLVETSGSNLVVKAANLNYSSNRYHGRVKIDNGAEERYIDVYQEPAVISVSYNGQIPASGGFVNIKINSRNLPWSARIINNWESGNTFYPHKAWLESSSSSSHENELLNQPSNGSFKVAFDALVPELKNKIPKVKIRVWIQGSPSDNVFQEFDVTQLPLQ